MKKAIVFPKGKGMPYVTPVADDIDCGVIAKELGFDWIEIVRPKSRLPKGFVMIVDEEGLLKPNDLNMVGSWFYGSDIHGEPIVGNVMILKEVWGDEGPELSGIDDDEVNMVFDSIGKEE